MARVRREPNFTPRVETAGPYEVRFRVSGIAQMGSGPEPGLHVTIYKDGHLVGSSPSFNSTTLCLPGYSVRGPEATAAEIVAAVLGDENVFTGAPSYPVEHDAARGVLKEAMTDRTET